LTCYKVCGKGLVVEHFSDTMIQAIKYVEHRFETSVVKAEKVN